MAQISHSIGLARILLICGLVFLHYGLFPNSPANPFEGLDIHQHRFATWLNSFVVFFFHSAVPLLSMISGWLFFTFLPQDAWASISRRMRSRLTTVYLPMVAWNALYLALIYAAFRAHPQSAAFSHATRFNIDFFTAGPMQYINSVFAVTDTPIGFQFWFVRDLFVTALVSPLWWLMICRIPWLGALIIGAIWLSGWNMVIFFRPDVPFFFYLGALIHQKHLRIVIPLRLTLILVALYVALVSLRALAPYVVAFPNHVAPYWIEVATRSMRIVGVIGCWGVIYRLARTQNGIFISGYGGAAFFLYSAHWPLLSVIKEAAWHFIPGQSDFWMLAHYVGCVTLTIVISMTIALTLARLSPGLFALMNGGRLLGQNKGHRAGVPVPKLAEQQVTAS